MDRHYLAEAVGFARKANQALSPRSCSDAEAREMLGRYAELEKLAAYGKAALAARLKDPGGLARASGTSMGKAREAVRTTAAAEKTPELGEALRAGELSLDQAAEITKTEMVAPGSAGRLLERVRGGAPLHVLKEDARRIRLEAQTRDGLAERQHEARFLHHGVTEAGMVRIEAEFEPHVGTPLVNRLQAQAKRLARQADVSEPFERHLADALPDLLDGDGPGRGRTEMVVLVSHGVADRGWQDVADGEYCKIPGVGPIDPRIARKIAGDAFLSGLFYDGEDLRNIRRFGRHIPAEIKTVLNLGEPPEFEGRRCIDCGNRFYLETDHQEPRATGGETALDNLKDRCDPCHDKKTKQDREAGLLRQRAPAARAAPT
ncbi:MAG: HNH endonuclease signature motif containing protein [Actinomycetota bacterium]|jgi:5-methylcytosine-specific restriction endonuclease McrA|nr:HNH endonuclease signature motif containing protein [Actinomycetota bacterium]